MRSIETGKPFTKIIAEDSPHPVFSEEFLYPRMTKTDARFILAVAEEYAAIIELLGPAAVGRLLGRYEPGMK